MSRRRQRYQQLRAEGILDKSPMALVDQGVNPFPPIRKSRSRLLKENGYCPYCEKKVGTGIAIHIKYCTKNVESMFDWKMKQRAEQFKKANRDAEKEKQRKRRIAEGASR